MKRRNILLAGVALAGCHATTWGQAYPDRSIKILQGFAPGGTQTTLHAL